MGCMMFWFLFLVNNGGNGILDKYISSNLVAKSFSFKKLISVDNLMRQHTRILVRSGCSSFLFDDWLGDAELVDLFHSESDLLRSSTFRDVYQLGARWDKATLNQVLLVEGIDLVYSKSFYIGDDDNLIWEPISLGMSSLA